MSIRLASYALLPVIFFAGVLAFWGGHLVSGSNAAASSADGNSAQRPPVNETFPFGDEAQLPPNHPPIRAAGSALGPTQAASGEPPAIVWRAPAAWKEAPSPNAMRLATYLAPGGVEISVARAGGATEANIQRWTDQFDDVGQQGRIERAVHGLHVVTVDIRGTYSGGGVGMGGPAQPKRDWAMVGSIVETGSNPYFFKMTGPAAAVGAARSAFDRFIDGISPT